MARSSPDRQLSEALAWGAEQETENGATWDDMPWDDCPELPQKPRSELSISRLTAGNEGGVDSWEVAAGESEGASRRLEEMDNVLEDSIGGHLSSEVEEKLAIKDGEGEQPGTLTVGLQTTTAADGTDDFGGLAGSSFVSAPMPASELVGAGLPSEEPNTLQEPTFASESRASKASGREESWVCAICHVVIPLAETAQIKGCEHAYCAQCILHWASYKQYPWCPQCRLPFDSLMLFKLLDGSLSDAMVEESVCLLLRAPWYEPLEVPVEADPEEESFVGEEDEYDEEEYYRASLRIGNRRWGQNGYVRGGRMQARVAVHQSPSGSSSSSRQGSAAAKASGSAAEQGMGRRAKRAQKREQADKTSAASSPGGGGSSSSAGSSGSASGATSTSTVSSGAAPGSGRRAQRRDKQKRSEHCSTHEVATA